MTDLVWNYRPNWMRDVRESLEWLTTVAGSPTGVEQRMSMRTAPRRTQEYEFLARTLSRQALQWLLVRQVGSTWLHPLWSDQITLTTDLASGSSAIFFATALREFSAGGKAVLTSGVTTEYEVVDISTVPSDRINLATPTLAEWPAGTRLYPLRRARMAQPATLRRGTDNLWVGTARFVDIEDSDFSTAHVTLATYLGDPVWQTPPNETSDLQTVISRLLVELDTQLAQPSAHDTASAALRTQLHSYFLHGASALAEFRSFVYSMRGRRGTFWMPTFADDFTIVEAFASGDDFIRVANAGYTAAAGIDNARDIRIALFNGTTIMRRITGASVVSPTVEELELSSTLGTSGDPEDVRRVDLMSLARLDTDLVDISHATDIAGMATANLAVRTHLSGRFADPWTPAGDPDPDPGDPVDPPVPVGDGNVMARVFFSAPFNVQFGDATYPLTVDAVAHDGTAGGVTFATGAVLKYGGSAEAADLFLEMIATDDNLVPLGPEMQPPFWTVEAQAADVSLPVDINTYENYTPEYSPTYAGVRVEYDPLTLLAADTVIVRGRRPDGVLLTLVFTYQIEVATVGVFVAVGGNNRAVVLRCVDSGVTWTDQTPTLSPDAYSWEFNDVAGDGAGVWVAVGFGPSNTEYAIRSTDNGLTWAAITGLPVSTGGASVNFVHSPAAGIFLMASNTQMWRSTDGGASWTELTLPFVPTSLKNMASNGAGVVIAAVRQNPAERYLRSTDNGATWSDHSLEFNFSTSHRISYANGQFIMGLITPDIMYSVTGAPGTWTLVSAPFTYTGATGHYVWDGTYYWGMAEGSAGQTRATSLTVDPDRNTTNPPGLPSARMAYGNGVVVFVNDAPWIRTTTGDLAPTNQTFPDSGGEGFNFEFHSVAFNG